MSIEPLVFKILADADDRGVRAMDRSVGNLDLSSRKASATMRSFVAELAQARTGADLASAAMSAFSKILGTTLAGTAVAMAGKVVIDAFQKVTDSVNKAKDSIALAREEIAKMGAVRGLAEGAAQANLLYKAALDAEKAIKEIEKSKLQNFIAEVRGAKTELAAMAEEARKAADSAKREGIERESAQRNILQNLNKEQEAARKVAEQYNASIDAARELEKSARDRMAQEAKAGISGPTQATQDLQKALDLQQSLTIEQQRAAAQAAKIAREEEARKGAPSLEERLKTAEAMGAMRAESLFGAGEAEARGAQAAIDIAKKASSLGIDTSGKSQIDIAKEITKAEMDASRLRIDELNLEERLIQQRKQVVQAEARVAERTIAGTGTGRGIGQRPSSLEVGMQKRAEHAARQAEFQFRKEEQSRVRRELQGEEIRRRMMQGERLGTQLPSISNYEVNKRLEEAVTKGQVEATRQEYDEARNARAGAQATEDTLRKVQDLLKTTLDKITTYAHAS